MSTTVYTGRTAFDHVIDQDWSDRVSLLYSDEGEDKFRMIGKGGMCDLYEALLDYADEDGELSGWGLVVADSAHRMLVQFTAPHGFTLAFGVHYRHA